MSGTVCDGHVTNITNFGMFVELEDDLEGLLHVSEIELESSKRMEDTYNVGDQMKVRVIHIDGVQKKIALSLKGLEGGVAEASVESEEGAARPSGSEGSKADPAVEENVTTLAAAFDESMPQVPEETPEKEDAKPESVDESIEQDAPEEAKEPEKTGEVKEPEMTEEVKDTQASDDAQTEVEKPE